MANSQIEALKRIYDFNAWRGRNTLRENLFLFKFFLNEAEIPGWMVDFEKSAKLPDGTVLTQSIRRSREPPSDVALRTDVFECASRLAAHELLMRLLANFQRPEVRSSDEIGDAAFHTTSGAGVLFARANLVLVIANAGAGTIRVAPLAQRIDRDICAGDDRMISPRRTRSGRTARPDGALGLRVRATQVRVGETIPIILGTSEQTVVSAAAANNQGVGGPPGSQAYYKIFTQRGEVSSDGERLVYRADTPGEEAVRVVVVNARRDLVRDSVRLTVR
jgi:hypothetical protein